MHISITGGNQGIGFYLAESLLEPGNQVTVLDVEITELLKLKEKYPAQLLPVICDVWKKAGKGKVIFTSSGVGIMGFPDISPYASSKGAIGSLAKCLNLEYMDKGIRFQLIHPPLTRTRSAAPLPVPRDFMADPKAVGYAWQAE